MGHTEYLRERKILRNLIFDQFPRLVEEYLSLSFADREALATYPTEAVEQDPARVIIHIYATAQRMIVDNNWLHRGDVEIAEELLSTYSDSCIEKLTKEVAFYILSTHKGRLSLSTSLLKRDPFTAAIDFGEAFARLTFSEAQLREILQNLGDSIIYDFAAHHVLGVFRHWAYRNSQTALNFLNKPFEFELAYAIYLAIGLIDYSEKNQEDIFVPHEQWLSRGGEHTELALALLPTLQEKGFLSYECALSVINQHAFNQDEKNRLIAINSLCNLVRSIPDQAGIALLRNAFQSTNPAVLRTLAQFLWRTELEGILELQLEFLESVVEVDFEDSELLPMIDRVLAQVAKQEPESVFRYFEKWINSRPKTNFRELFGNSGFMRTINVLDKSPGLIAKTCTQWLMATRETALASGNLLNIYKLCALDDGLVATASDTDLETLINRVLAVFFEDPAQQIRLLCSLSIHILSEGSKSFLGEALAEVCFNFPGATTKILKENSDEPWCDFLTQTLQSQHLGALDAAKSYKLLREFLSPDHLIELYNEHSTNLQQEIQRDLEAQGQFVFSSLVKKVAVGRGNQWIISTGNDSTPGNPSQIQEFSQSLEYPRLELLDPVGQAFKRIERLAGTGLA